MANKPKTEQVTIKAPNGEDIDLVVPVGMPDAQVQAMLRQRAPELFQKPTLAPPGMPAFPSQGYKPSDAAYNAGKRETPPFAMKESLAPKIVRGAASALPVAGGIGGGLLGAPAFGAGGLVGAGLGAAGGEAGNIAIKKGLESGLSNNKFTEKPTSIKDDLKDIGMTGGLAAASEIPGALAVSAGNRVLARIAASKSPKEAGDAMQAILDARPAGFSAKGLQRDLDMAFGKISKNVGELLRGYKNQIYVDHAINAATAEAKAANKVIPGVSKQFDKIISAAKYNAGIKGPTATADQLFKFQQELYREGYRGNPGPVSEVLKSLLKRTGEESGTSLRVMVPEIDAPLKGLTNLHAADSALKRYSPGKAASMASSAALHPRTAAALSVPVGAAAIAGADKATDLVKKTAGVGVEP